MKITRKGEASPFFRRLKAISANFQKNFYGQNIGKNLRGDLPRDFFSAILHSTAAIVSLPPYSMVPFVSKDMSKGHFNSVDGSSGFADTLLEVPALHP